MTKPSFRSSDLAMAAGAFGAVVTVVVGSVPALGWPVAVPVAVIMVILGVGAHRPAVILLAVIIIVNSRASQQVQILARPQPTGTITGVARVISDPEVSAFDVRSLITVNGRRYVASVPMEQAYKLRSVSAGEHIRITGKVRPLTGAPRGWVLSNHLEGRLKLASVEHQDSGRFWFRLANNLRDRIERSASSMNPNQRALYLGLVVGDDREQSDLQAYRFKASGLSHLLAVSGQNIAFVLLLASPLLTRIGPRASLAVAVPLLVVFGLVTRAEPSVLRAVVMAMVSMSAVAFDRPASGFRVLAVTVMVLLLIDPLIAHSVGFQLSCVATLGLIVLGEVISRRIPGPRGLSVPIGVTLAAQVSTAPIIFGFNASIPYVATLTNLLTVPLSGLVMMVGLTVGLVAGSLHAGISAVVMCPIRWIVSWIDLVAEVGSRLPVAPLTPTRFVVFVAALAMVLVSSRSLAPSEEGKDSDQQFHDDPRAALGAWLVRCVGIVALIVLALPIGPGATKIGLADKSAVWVRLCGSGVLVVRSGSDAVSILGELKEHHINSIDVIVRDKSRSAEAAAMTVSEQLTPQRLVELEPDRISELLDSVDRSAPQC